MATINTKQGDRTSWQWTLYSAGTAVDLSTGVSDVVLYVRADGASVNKIDGSSADSYDAAGLVTYTPTEDDVNTAGEYDMMTVVQYSDGTHSKFPSEGYDKVYIEEAIDE